MCPTPKLRHPSPHPTPPYHPSLFFLQGGGEVSAKVAPLEAPVLPAVEGASTKATTDVHNLKVQVEPAHGVPVVELDQTDLSPLAHHLSAFAPQESNDSAAAPDDQGEEAAAAVLPTAASTLPLVDNPAPKIDDATTVLAESAEKLDALVPNAEEAVKPDEAFLPSADGNATLGGADLGTGRPSLADKEEAAVKTSAGVDVCGITDGGIADTAATFGVVDLSEIMAQAVTDAPDSEVKAAAPRVSIGRGSRPSQRPGRKGYITAASSATSEEVGAAGIGEKTKVSLSARAEGPEAAASAAADPYTGSPPQPNSTEKTGSPDKKDCVIS